MNLTFFGLKQAFDYFQIGGTESFVRRLAVEMVQRGYKVDYVLYGGNNAYKQLSPLPGITLKYFKSIEEALNAIKQKKYEHVVTIYLFPKDRFKYASFRRKNKELMVFHFCYFGWPDSIIKRKLYFSEARIFPYNGKLFCISKRQYDYVSRWEKNAVYLLPPVPENYFLKPEEKPINGKMRITFLGRIDPGKGIKEVIDIFRALKDDKKFECSIYGVHISEHKESLRIHNWLKSQKDIKYVEVDRKKYSSAVEEFVRSILKETDIFIQPYQKLSSTIDTPLLLLETMASLCAVITKPFGNIPDVYGKSRFLISPERFFSDAINQIRGITKDDLIEERNRIYKQNKKLDFSLESVVNRFINGINKN